MDRHVVLVQMLDGAFDWAIPFKTEIAVAGLHRQTRDLGGADALAVDVELLVTEAISPANRALHQLGAHDVAIEGVGAIPVGDMDDAVVELGGNSHRYTPSFLPTRSATARRS